MKAIVTMGLLLAVGVAWAAVKIDEPAWLVTQAEWDTIQRKLNQPPPSDLRSRTAAVFQLCSSRDTVPLGTDYPIPCQWFDLDGDGDVDQSDWGRLQIAMDGEGKLDWWRADCTTRALSENGRSLTVQACGTDGYVLEQAFAAARAVWSPTTQPEDAQ